MVSQLKSLNLRARLIVEGFLIGLHRSPLHGFSVEFAEHRLYNPGDEIRWIDWKVYARTDRLYIRKFEEETNLKAYILLDASGSMAYPEEGVTKFEYARNLAAALMYLLIKQRDAAGLLLFDEVARTYIPPKATQVHLHRLLIRLAQARPGGKTDPGRALRGMAERIRKRGLVILLSDLFTDPELLLPALKLFRHRKHEVLVFHILHPSELDLPERPAVFEDLETQERLPYDPSRLRRTYRERLDRFIHHLKHSLRASHISYELFTTDLPYDRALLFYLKKRERLF